MKIYLAGGFRTKWQQQAHLMLTEHEILDPSSHGIESPAEYTEWDLGAIRAADCVLAYMESSNPAGYSLAMEIGYAHALSKPIYFVEEHADANRHRYFAMIREVATKRFSTIAEAINWLRLEA